MTHRETLTEGILESQSPGSHSNEAQFEDKKMVN